MTSNGLRERSGQRTSQIYRLEMHICSLVRQKCLKVWKDDMPGKLTSRAVSDLFYLLIQVPQFLSFSYPKTNFDKKEILIVSLTIWQKSEAMQKMVMWSSNMHLFVTYYGKLQWYLEILFRKFLEWYKTWSLFKKWWLGVIILCRNRSRFKFFTLKLYAWNMDRSKEMVSNTHLLWEFLCSLPEANFSSFEDI